ncbi:putative intracellular protease/amidase [Catenulispora sp. EB89]
MPHKIFTETGWDITIATPEGKTPTLDKLSMSFTAGWPTTLREVAKYLATIKPRLDQPEVLAGTDPADFDLVFYPGGHGPMEDLATDPVSGALLTAALHFGKPLALLCHGPAATFAARNADGTWPFDGYRMTALSNFEEKLNSFGRRAQWLLEDRLRADGAVYEKGRIPLRPFTVVDRNVYTGQNPASATHLARQLVADLKNSNNPAR